MNKFRKYLLIAFLTFFSVLLYADETIRIATGNPAGIYYKLGKALKEILEETNPGYKVEIISTSGSIENAELIRNNLADIAFIQNDIAYDFITGENLFPEGSSSMKGIA